MDKVDEWKFGPFPLACVDEVGRGCLAGPVYAVAVSPRAKPPRGLFCDSKLLSAEKRKSLISVIEEHFFVGLGIASVEEINAINILQASLLAMKRAVGRLPLVPNHLLIDGNMKIPNIKIQQTTLIKGDLRSEWIGAASIFAKVKRDDWMAIQAKKYPQYGFEKHKGYGTEEHRRQISACGPCLLHRAGFRGVKEWLQSPPRERDRSQSEALS